MRIAIIVPDFGAGGLFQFYNQLVPALAQQAEVHLVFASTTPTSEMPSIAGATCHIVQPEDAAPVLSQFLRGPLAIAPSTVHALAVAHQAWRIAQTLAPDCIEVCDWPLGSVPAILDMSVPTILQCHGSMAQISLHDPTPGGGVEGTLLRLLEPQLIGLAQRVQTYSEANASSWEAAAGRSVQVIRPAFALGSEPTLSLPQSGRITVFGRLQAWKGPQVLCEALERLGNRAPVCDWYGGVKPWPGTGLPADRHLAAAFPAVWGRCLRIHAPVGRMAVAQLMGESRAVVVPSVWDVFNFTAIEAMAAARPVVVSTGAGASELIDDGVNGFTFANGDAEALAAALERLLALSPVEAQAMGEAGRETVRRELDPVKIAAEHVAAFGSVVAAHDAAPPNAAPIWLRDILTPGTMCDFHIKDFLDTLPARPLLRSVAGRARRKFLKG